MERLLKTTGFLLLMLQWPGMAAAQQPVGAVADGTTVLFSGPHFFAAIVAGVILAIAFQLVLTTVSVAAGVSALNIPGESETPRATRDLGETVRKANSAIGLWALITASVALFFASWLAVELSLTLSALVGAVLGLVIWGLFYVILAALDIKIFSSLAGTLVRTATSGMRSLSAMATSLFSGATEKGMGGGASELAGRVQQRVFGDMDLDRFRADMKDYANRVDSPELDPDRIRDDLQRMLVDPKGGADSLLRRLESIDRNALKSAIAAKRDVSEDEAERMVGEMESTRDEMVAKARRMRSEMERRMEEAKREALELAEETRKTAANAAWWASATAVVSGIAAIIGGVIGAG